MNSSLSDNNNLHRLTRCAIIVTINLISSYIFKFLPNVKPDTTFVIILAIYFSLKESIAVFTATVILRGFLYGVGTFMPFQWFAWFIIAIVAYAFRGILKRNKILFMLYAGLSGYIFGLIVSLDVLILYGVRAFTLYYLNGLLFDTFHFIGNCVFSIILLNIVLKANEFVKNHQEN